jgi:cyanate permease
LFDNKVQSSPSSTQSIPTKVTPSHPESYKWSILGLVVLTNILAIGMPAMGMSVMSKEISQDLHLNLTQVGVIWGIGTLPGILTALFGGALGDKFGPRKILILTCFLAGILGACRGLADSYLSLVIIILILGAISPIVIMNNIKTIGQWFPGEQIILANGLASMGMALGFFLGSLLSATIFSPLLGGWRNVLILYGLLSGLYCIPWYFTHSKETTQDNSTHGSSIASLVQYVIKQKESWLLGLALLGIGGCIQGMLGYIPLYLRNIGWAPIQADGALSVFHTISLISILPIALWARKLGKQKGILIIAASLIALGAAMLAFADGMWVWAAILIAGCVRDAFMAVFITLVISLKNIGSQYAGTATGFTIAVGAIGNAITPPLGNSLAIYWPGAPFLLWGGFAIFGMFCLMMVKEEKKD